MDMDALGAARRRAQHGWPARFPVAQFPNTPLLAALAGWVVARFADGDLHDLGRAVLLLGLAVWAYGELTQGVNWFRRLLGAGFLVWLVLTVADHVDG